MWGFCLCAAVFVWYSKGKLVELKQNANPDKLAFAKRTATTSEYGKNITSRHICKTKLYNDMRLFPGFFWYIASLTAGLYKF